MTDEDITKDNKEIYDLAVIGGGPAGYVSAIRGAQLGARVILFEKDSLGGTCLNRGCIPTKTYLKTAEYIHNIKNSPKRGIIVNTDIKIDLPKAVQHKNSIINTLKNGVLAILKSNDVKIINGCARLIDKNSIECLDKIYRAKKIILCGGSRVSNISSLGFSSENVLTSDEILNLEYLPKDLGIIGGGVIGCEMAEVFSTFGSSVTIIEAKERILPMFDKDISNEIGKAFKANGINIISGTKILDIKDYEDGVIVKTEKEELKFNKLLLSIGRTPNLECLGGLRDIIKTENGRVIVDETMKTSIENIYACGDINGISMLAHSAFKMGEVGAENCISGGEREVRLKNIPSCIYTNPEAAFVGLTEDEAKRLYPKGIRVGRFRMEGNGRSLASGERQGFVKVIADNEFGEILGVHIVGGVASEIIVEATTLMDMEITVNEVADSIIHPHPSYSEAIFEACSDTLGRGIHIVKKKSK